MAFLFFFLALLCIGVIIFTKVDHSQKVKRREKLRIRVKSEAAAAEEDPPSPEKIEEYLDRQHKFLPDFTKPLLVATAVFILGSVFNNVFFYAEPSYNYHVRTIAGTESVVMGKTGWNLRGFGRVTAWKRNMTVQSSKRSASDDSDNEVVFTGEGGSGSDNISANLGSIKVIFLDQVDSKVYATTRFSLPITEDEFLTLVHDYRTPDNLLRTSLIPSFKETLSATSSLMSAEEYFSGGKTEFNVEFQNQMTSGIFIVKRIEKRVEDGSVEQKASANANKAAKGQRQDTVQATTKVVFVVEKQLGEDGITPRRKNQKFKDFGIRVVEARVTDVIPNDEFNTRMKQKQQASADRAIARERRIQEEEQKLFAIAEGERKVAEKQADAKVVQIEKTTQAETTKQLAITKAEQQYEQARIEKETAAEALLRDKIKAKGIRVLADAEAHKKKVLIQADGALKVKLDALVAINDKYAAAWKERKVPNTVIYSGGGEQGGLGSDSEVQNILNTQLLKNVKALNLDMGINK